MAVYWHEVRVYLEDTDAQGVVYNASYFRFMERARTDWLRVRGFDHSTFADTLGLAVVLTSIEARCWQSAPISPSSKVRGPGSARKSGASRVQASSLPRAVPKLPASIWPASARGAGRGRLLKD